MRFLNSCLWKWAKWRTLKGTVTSPWMKCRTGGFFGHSVMPEKDSKETQALVFMLSGPASRWKQTVAYYLTTKLSDPKMCADAVKSIIEKASAIGLKTCCLTSNVGSPNRGVWNAHGLQSGTSCLNYKCLYPGNEETALHFISWKGSGQHAWSYKSSQQMTLWKMFSCRQTRLTSSLLGNLLAVPRKVSLSWPPS